MMSLDASVTVLDTGAGLLASAVVSISNPALECRTFSCNVCDDSDGSLDILYQWKRFSSKYCSGQLGSHGFCK
ncbi:hypothetical protein CGCF415_v009935 [Colletotrichum fructicola]|nr:hypothetical protein CGCFRS4_v010269 [Colletotrichum fructicola]KAF4900903.1 hypothetical protein CGCF415_v009935 [Colletotrichum fructicola]KAF4934237.1 hypothetical protein CGCF245_v008744 [Colletotrichum fructicola]